MTRYALILLLLAGCEPPRPVDPVEPEPTDAAAKLTVAAEKAIRDYARAWEEHESEAIETGEKGSIEDNRAMHNEAFRPLAEAVKAAAEKGTPDETIHRQLRAGFKRLRK